MRRSIAISLLLLVFTWPVETAVAAVAMQAEHACCQPKAAAPTCHDHGHEHGPSGPAMRSQHRHDQCPMDCCSRRQASSSAAPISPAELRVVVVQRQQVVLRKLVPHSSDQALVHSERGPPSLG